jgi:uncharacterized membrane protein
MDLHGKLLELTEQYRLGENAAARLAQLANLEAEPTSLERHLAFGLAILGAALAGLGIIFWVAANWDLFSRTGRFALLQSVVVILCAGAIMLPAARQALGLLALLAVGALLAYFGQTYQTGADPWQLFALWSALSLPLCLSIRSDVLWLPWVVVAMGAVTLWLTAYTGWALSGSPDPRLLLAGWSAAFLVMFGVHPALRRYTGAGPWGMRAAATATALVLIACGLLALINKTVEPEYYMAITCLAGGSAMLCMPRWHDTFALSTLGLALNVLLVAGLAKALIEKAGHKPIVESLIVGVVAAALLAATVRLVILMADKHRTGVAA